MQRSHRHRCDCGGVSKELKIYVGCIDRAMLELGRLDKVPLLTHRDEVEKQDWIVTRCLTYFILTPVCSIICTRIQRKTRDPQMLEAGMADAMVWKNLVTRIGEDGRWKESRYVRGEDQSEATRTVTMNEIWRALA